MGFGNFSMLYARQGVRGGREMQGRGGGLEEALPMSLADLQCVAGLWRRDTDE